MDENLSTTQVVPDFIFGTLATDTLRIESLIRERKGLWHDAQLDPPDPLPEEPIAVRLAVGPDVPADRATLYYTTDGSVPRGSRGQAERGTALAMKPVATTWETLVWGYRDLWQGIIPPQPDGVEVRYILEAWQSTGPGSWYAGQGDGPQVYGFIVDREAVPEWIRDAVIYQIFVDRFAPDPGTDFERPTDPLGGFYGGTLRGILSRLDYLADLGVTCLWLSPIFPSPTHHGYDATDYGTVEPRLGNEADLQMLLDGAHRRGMRVILDFVANHLSRQHPAFVEAQRDRESETAQWFTFEEWPSRYRSFFGVPEMPQINTDHPAARAYLIEHAQRWLRFGVDGFRLDYANGPSHAFWSAFRAATRAVKPDSVTLGEVVETSELQRSYVGRMDGTLDFLLLEALRGFFSFRRLAPSQFDAFLRRHLAFFPESLILPSFLDNHDMNRFLWTVGGDVRRLRLAALCQFTLPGPPIIYYGTEVGLSQNRDVRYPDGSGHPEEARLPMVWDDRQKSDLLTYFRKLINLRREGGSAWREARRTELIDDERGLYAYSCGDFIVVLNNHPAEATIVVDAWRGAALALSTEPALSWHPAKCELRLPPFAGACLRRSLPPFS